MTPTLHNEVKQVNQGRTCTTSYWSRFILVYIIQ